MSTYTPLRIVVDGSPPEGNHIAILRGEHVGVTVDCRKNFGDPLPLARLIAAASDLLEATRLAYDALYSIAKEAGNVPFWDEGGEGYIAHEAAGASIAKAEGRP